MGTLEHPHPEGLLHNPAFSQVVAASGRRTIYTAGQVSIDGRGALVGAADLAAQTAQDPTWTWLPIPIATETCFDDQSKSVDNS